MRSIENACDELSNSERLRELFRIIVGIMGTVSTSKARAFSLKSLQKLNQVKGPDDKASFLHCVVPIVQSNSKELLDFMDDLPTVATASNVDWDQCVSKLDELEIQLESLRKLALHQGKSNKVDYKLQKSTYFNASEVQINEPKSLDDEIVLLHSTEIGKFTLRAIHQVSQLLEQVDATNTKVLGDLEYLSESEGSKMKPHELFGTISEFCDNFDAARTDVDKKSGKVSLRSTDDTGSKKENPKSTPSLKGRKVSIAPEPTPIPTKKKSQEQYLQQCQYQEEEDDYDEGDDFGVSLFCLGDSRQDGGFGISALS